METEMTEMEHHYSVELHGDSAGRREYEERRHDVDVCGKEDNWAWPLGYVDEVYIRRVGIPIICNGCGIRADEWKGWASTWCVAFRRGYEAAHNEWLRGQATDSSSFRA